MAKPKDTEYWWVTIDGDDSPIIVQVSIYAYPNRTRFHVYPCGDSQGWDGNQVTRWIERIRNVKA